MAGIITVIYTNGVVISTYDNGSPCHEYSGELPILHTIFRDIKNKDSKLKNTKLYISDDPLSENIIEVKSSNIEHWLKFITDYVTTSNKPVEEILSNVLNKNINFDNEKSI